MKCSATLQRWAPDVSELTKATSFSENVNLLGLQSQPAYVIFSHVCENASLLFNFILRSFVNTYRDRCHLGLTENQQFSPLCHFYNEFQEFRVVATVWQPEGNRKWSATQVQFSSSPPLNHEAFWEKLSVGRVPQLERDWKSLIWGFKNIKI